MSILQFRQAPLSVPIDDKRDMRTQFGALCYRIVKDKPQILLVTSRGSKRWIIPKGWPMENVTPAKAALTEAWEEAGVKGKSFDQCLGLYTYVKDELGKKGAPCAVLVYPVKVKSLKDEFPEATERKRKWVSRKKAASMVDEKELKHILRNFDPKLLRR